MYLRGGQTIKDTDMEQVVLFCRVSTQIQDYERQVSDLTLLAERHNWSIAEYCCPLKLFIQNKLGLTLLTKYQPF